MIETKKPQMSTYSVRLRLLDLHVIMKKSQYHEIIHPIPTNLRIQDVQKSNIEGPGL